MKRNRTLLFAICVLTLGSFGASAENLDVCGVRFVLPAGWHPAESQGPEDCSRTIEPLEDEVEPSGRPTFNTSVDIYVTSDHLREVTKQWGITKRLWKWRADDPRELEDIAPLNVGCWRGVSATRNDRLYGRHGYVGMGQRTMAIASDGQFTITLDGQPDTPDVIAQLLHDARPVTP